eukprot:scaffold5449_cov52-Cyclotella_meneghiniana.AAC.14
MDLYLRRSYVGISRTRRSLGHGGRLLSKIRHLYDKTTSILQPISTSIPPVTTPNPTVSRSLSKTALKSAVEKYYFTDQDFAAWLLELLCIAPTYCIMPHNATESQPPPPPDNTSDFPTLSEAARVSSKRLKSNVFGDATSTTSNDNRPPVVESPIRPAGSKRNMTTSPHQTPQRMNDTISDINKGGEGTAIRPRDLEQRLKLLEKKESLTVEDVRAVTTDKDWFGATLELKETGLEEVLKPVDLPVGWHYNFDDTPVAPITTEVSQQYNMERIVAVCSQRAMKATNPVESPYHFSKSPFGLVPVSKSKVNVVTRDGKVAGTFSSTSYELKVPKDIAYDLESSGTYQIICRAKLSTLSRALRSLRKSSPVYKFLLDRENGEVNLTVSECRSKVTIYTYNGMIATVNLVESMALDEAGISGVQDKEGEETTKSSRNDKNDKEAEQLDWLVKGKDGRIKFGENTVKTFAADCRDESSNNRFAPLSEPSQKGDATTSTPSGPSNDNSASTGKPKKKRSSKKGKSVDDLSLEEIESIISGESESGSQAKERRTRSKNKSKSETKKSSSKSSVGSDSSGDSANSSSGSTSSDDESDLTEALDDEVGLQQVPLPEGKEGVRISTKTKGGSETATTSASTASQDDVLCGTKFGNNADFRVWPEEIELSGDEADDPPVADIKDKPPSTPATHATEETSETEISAITDPSLSSLKAKAILDYFSNISSDVEILPTTSSPTGTQLPSLQKADDSHFPSDYKEVQRYFNVSQAYILESSILDATTLHNRRKTKEYNWQKKKEGQGGKGKRASLKKKAKGFEFDHGPCELWFTFSILTKYPSVSDMLTSLNIDLGSELGIKCTMKNVQCFDSRAKYMLTCVNSNLCPQGVRAMLENSLFREQRRLCLSGKLETTDYYDRPIPQIKVYVKPMRPLGGIPNNEKDSLTFDVYPQYTRPAYHIEAAEADWSLLEVLLDEYADSGRIGNDFGPAAFLLENPPAEYKPGLTVVRNYHQIGRISCGHNLRTTVMECRHVSHWHHPVKVAMREKEKIDPVDGKPTGEMYEPERPYTRTTLAKELSNLTINGEQVFLAVVVNQAGPDVGVTNVVVANDPECPYTPAIRQFAQNTLADLNCFMYHHLTINMGYCKSTVQRLINCCYMTSAALASESTWDPILQKATPRFQDRKKKWLEKHKHLDYMQGSGSKSTADQPMLGNSPIEMSDDVRLELVKKLNCSADMTAKDVLDEDGHASALTGRPEKSVNTLNTEGNTVNQERQKKELTIELAMQKQKLADAEQAANERVEETRRQAEEMMARQMADMQAQMEHFKALALAATQGSNNQSVPMEVTEDSTSRQVEGSIEDLRRGVNANAQAGERPFVAAGQSQQQGPPHLSGGGTFPPSHDEGRGAQEPLRPHPSSGSEEQLARTRNSDINSGSVVGIPVNVNTPSSGEGDSSLPGHVPTIGDSGRGGGRTSGRSSLSTGLLNLHHSAQDLTPRTGAQFASAGVPATSVRRHGRRGGGGTSGLSPLDADSPSNRSIRRNNNCGQINSTLAPDGNVCLGVQSTNNIPWCSAWSVGYRQAPEPGTNGEHISGVSSTRFRRSRGTNSTRGEKRRKRDQARQDQYRASRMSREQKRRMRQLTSGSRKFMKSIQLSHSELRDGVKSYDRERADYSVPTNIDPDLAAVDRASATEAREINTLLHLLHEGGDVGSISHDKRAGWVRIMFENFNSIGIGTQGGKWTG